MRLSTRSRYAVMALVGMAGREGAGGHGGAPLTLAEIAAEQMLSPAYLEQLFGRLRRAGLVQSARGPGGGYRLARAPESITIAEVVEAVDEPLGPSPVAEGGPGRPEGRGCPTQALWAELGEQIRLFLAAVTVSDVVRGRVRGRAARPEPAQPEPALADPADAEP